MKKAMDLDLIAMAEVLESFTKKLEKLPQDELIDLAARLKAVAKHCTTIDEYVKKQVKAKLQHNEGVLPGGHFKALLKLVAISRLNQKRLKEEKPSIHAAYCEDCVDERVNFEPR